jgi:RNA polymerase sigma-70 factor (ECF subfamily)
MDIPDNTLILRVADGDYVSYNQLFMRYYSRLCAFVSEIINDAAMSEDIVQEFYIKLWINRKHIKISKNVRAYLFTSCRNLALNYIRDENTRKKNLGNFPVKEEPEEENILEREEYLTALEHCIGQLPERCKQVFLMHKFEELPQKEISEKLNISVKTIKNQIWKSLQYLRECLGQNDV